MSNHQTTSLVVQQPSIITMTNTEFEAFTAGYTAGYLAADEAAERREEAHRAALHHEAYVVVQRMAGLPTHDELTARRNARAVA